jgi:hypothetical protein
VDPTATLLGTTSNWYCSYTLRLIRIMLTNRKSLRKSSCSPSVRSVKLNFGCWANWSEGFKARGRTVTTPNGCQAGIPPISTMHIYSRGNPLFGKREIPAGHPFWRSTSASIAGRASGHRPGASGWPAVRLAGRKISLFHRWREGQKRYLLGRGAIPGRNAVTDRTKILPRISSKTSERAYPYASIGYCAAPAHAYS